MGYNFHELRHTQATFLIGNGIDPKSVQGRLGHEVSSMTMDVYAHTVGQNDREAAELMGRLLQTGGAAEAPGDGTQAAKGQDGPDAGAPREEAPAPTRFTVVGPNPDKAPCPGAKLVEREVMRYGRPAWVEEWRITVSSVAELLETQRGAGTPLVIDGSRLTVMAMEA